MVWSLERHFRKSCRPKRKSRNCSHVDSIRVFIGSGLANGLLARRLTVGMVRFPSPLSASFARSLCLFLFSVSLSLSLSPALWLFHSLGLLLSPSFVCLGPRRERARGRGTERKTGRIKRERETERGRGRGKEEEEDERNQKHKTLRMHCNLGSKTRTTVS